MCNCEAFAFELVPYLQSFLKWVSQSRKTRMTAIQPKPGDSKLNKFLFTSLWNPDIDTKHWYRQSRLLSHATLDLYCFRATFSSAAYFLQPPVTTSTALNCNWGWEEFCRYFTNKVHSSWDIDENNHAITRGHTAQSCGWYRACCPSQVHSHIRSRSMAQRCVLWAKEDDFAFVFLLNPGQAAPFLPGQDSLPFLLFPRRGTEEI